MHYTVFKLEGLLVWAAQPSWVNYSVLVSQDAHRLLGDQGTREHRLQGRGRKLLYIHKGSSAASKANVFMEVGVGEWGGPRGANRY